MCTEFDLHSTIVVPTSNYSFSDFDYTMSATFSLVWLHLLLSVSIDFKEPKYLSIQDYSCLNKNYKIHKWLDSLYIKNKKTIMIKYAQQQHSTWYT